MVGRRRHVFLFVMALMMGVMSTAVPAHADSGRPDPRIINGTAIPITDAPWQVGLLSVPYGLAQYCGGSIIDARWIVTAAHCVSDISWLRGPDDVEILAGSASVAVTPRPTTYQVALILTHPEYDASTYTNDIALLKMASPIPVNGTTMAPIVLPTQDPAMWPAKGTRAFISGWGNTSTTEMRYPDELQGAYVDVLGSPTATLCGQYPFDEYLPLQMLCAGTSFDPFTDTCQGDSGGPLAINVAGTWTLAGITSWGEGCAQPGYPGVYTRVTTYASWLTRTTAADWGLVAGAVDSSHGPVDRGRVEFYPRCEDWQNRVPTAAAEFTRTYQVTVPAGSYRVRIVPAEGEHAVLSWHDAASTCAEATVVNVAAGSSLRALRAVPATRVTGSVYNDQNHRIASGTVEFYPTCQDWARGNASAQATLNGDFVVSVPAGPYRIRILNRDTETGMVTSWHSAKPTCETADVIMVPTTVDDFQQRLVALSTAPAPQPTPTPTPTPTAKSDQTVKAPRATAKKNKQVRLAARTMQGQKVTWSTTNAKVCGISKDKVRTKRKGTCTVIANASSTSTLNPLTQRFRIRVK